MILIYLQVAGCAILVVSSFVLGIWLKRHPSKNAAEITSRIMHFFIIIAWVIPIGTGFTMLTEYDELLSMPSLPFPMISQVTGALVMLIGFGFFVISIAVLLDRGGGLPAFELTNKLAAKDIYKHTRNPMSLGVYLICIGLSILGGSTFFILWSLIVIIPAHVFFLKYFEERELEIRFGDPYREYRRKVPFLIPNFRKSYETELTNKNGDK
ncbi:methyltransferase family protein [Pelotomaculum propionicicum]|uniref:methyltransferase family protein n=1 Tax=Pelotomaculum propionicicum TaxID=258475 RepID=UPI003B75F0EC